MSVIILHYAHTYSRAEQSMKQASVTLYAQYAPRIQFQALYSYGPRVLLAF